MVGTSFLTGEQRTADIQPVDYGEGDRSHLVSEAAGPVSSPGASANGGVAGPRRVSSVRAALAEHPGEIFVLSSSRRIPVDTLLEHLAEPGTRSKWADADCEIFFEAKIDPCAAPSSDPCWHGMRGPLYHLWSAGTPDEPGKLIGLILPDQRAAPCPDAIGSLLREEGVDTDERQAPPPGEPPAFEIELSDLVVEGQYHPRIPETDPAILALSPPEGEGWQGRWWKLGTRPLWQYGWWRWE